MNASTDLAWRKSSRSGPNGDCVEVAALPDGVAVRDSKSPAGPVLRLSRGEMAALLGRLR